MFLVVRDRRDAFRFAQKNRLDVQSLEKCIFERENWCSSKLPLLKFWKENTKQQLLWKEGMRMTLYVWCQKREKKMSLMLTHFVPSKTRELGESCLSRNDMRTWDHVSTLRLDSTPALITETQLKPAFWHTTEGEGRKTMMMMVVTTMMMMMPSLLPNASVPEEQE